MGLFDKKEGGSKVGNLLRTMKNISGPVIGIVDDLVLGGKFGQAMDLIKGDGMTEPGCPPLTADDLVAIQRAMDEDVQHAREYSLQRLESNSVPKMAKLMPSVLDVVVITIWGLVTIGLMTVATLQILGKATGTDTVLAMAVFTGVTTLAKDIISFHRGGNNNEQNEHAARMMGR